MKKTKPIRPKETGHEYRPKRTKCGKRRTKKLTGKAFLDFITGGFEHTPGTTEEILQWLREQG